MLSSLCRSITFIPGMKMKMKERLVKDKAKIFEIINGSQFATVSLIGEDGKPYAVPLNFGITGDEDKPIFYFHGSKVGRKAKCMKSHQTACVTFVQNATMKHSVNGMPPSMYYDSVIAEGKIKLVSGIGEKSRGLDIIMQRHGDNYKSPLMFVLHTGVFKFEPDVIVGKHFNTDNDPFLSEDTAKILKKMI